MTRPLILTTGSLAVIAAVLAVIWTMQRRLMYFPMGGVPAPGEIGLTGVEPVTFETTDGLRLGGWFVAASGPSPRVTVLVFNGNAGNRSHRAPLGCGFPAPRIAGSSPRLSGLRRQCRDSDRERARHRQPRRPSLPGRPPRR